MKKRIFSLILVAAILLCGICFAEPAAELGVHSISKYGNVVLNIWADDFEALGFALGDDVTVQTGDFAMDMPYLDGFYVYSGEYLLRRTGDGGLDLCINYGNFAEAAGVGEDSEIRIILKEKAGSLALQGTGALNYTDERADYAGDEIFANHRMVGLGGIADGVLYRSASPVNNDRNRAAISCALMADKGISAVVNLADSDEAIAEYASAEGFDSAYYMDLYEEGKVIALDMDVNFRSEDFNLRLIKGLNFLAEQEGPYLIHCNEGKDRAGFAVALIGALMGATAEEIALDYMTSYENYYHLDPEDDEERYALIMDGNVMEMLRYIAGLEEGELPEGTDLAMAAEEYLLSHGMPQASIDKLREKLSA